MQDCLVNQENALSDHASPIHASGIFETFWPPSDGRPVVLDIGCGKGRHLRARAAAHPDTWFIGIDRLMPRLRRLAKRAGRDGTHNIRLWHSDAHEALLYFMPPHSIHACTLFFPDPWPKRRHHHRRLITPAFLRSLLSRLIPGGTIYIATDDTDYFNWICRLFGRHPSFRAVPALMLSPEQQTDFERLFIELQKPIYRCAYQLQVVGCRLKVEGCRL